HCGARVLAGGRISGDLQPMLGRANTTSGVDACAHIHHANAAHAHGSLVLQVAERRDKDAVHPGRVEDGGAFGDSDLLTVNRQLYFGDGGWAHATPRKQTPAGQAWLTRCSSTS